MCRYYSLFITIAFLPVLTGCLGERKEPEAKVQDAQDAGQNTKVNGKDQDLTTEIAKRTLLEMDFSQVYAGVMIPAPKDEPITVINADEIAIGGWKCNLKKKTFHAEAFFPEAPRHKINQVIGVFERTPNGKWVAKVTKSSSGG